MTKLKVGEFYRFVTNYASDVDSIIIVDESFPFDDFERERLNGYVDAVPATEEEVEYAKWCINNLKARHGNKAKGGAVSGMKYWLQGIKK